MKNKILKPLLFSFVIVLMGIIFVSTPTEAKIKSNLTAKQSKKASKNIKFIYNTDTNQLTVKSYKKMNYFKYKKGKKIKKADKKYFNKYFEVDNFSPAWVDGKKIKEPLFDKNNHDSPLYGLNYEASEKEENKYFEKFLGGEVVKKLTPGWHKIKVKLIYYGLPERYFYYTGKIYVTESVEFSNNYSSQSKNIYACKMENSFYYKYIGFKTESNFNGKLDMKAVFKVDANHFIKGTGKKCGFSSDAECLKFLQENIKEDVVLEKSFDMKPFNTGKIYTLKATDFPIYNTVKEKTDYKYNYKDIYTPSGKYVRTISTRTRTSIDLFWKCIRPVISVKITSKDSGKVFLDKTFSKVNENIGNSSGAWIPDDFEYTKFM